MEYNKEPSDQWAWNKDEAGNFLRVRFNEGVFDFHEEDSFVFHHPFDPRLDHIFKVFDYEEVENENDHVRGKHLFRYHIESIGRDFDQFVEEVIRHGFKSYVMDEAHPDDIAAWEQLTKETYYEPTIIDNVVIDTDKVVLEAMAKFDSEWYYRGQEHNLGF